MNRADKYILADQWRPERKAKDEHWKDALKGLVAQYGKRAVASRLDVSMNEVGDWLKGRKKPAYQNHESKILSWWGEAESADMDDATIYFVQALRSIERDATIEDETVGIPSLVTRLEAIREMTERTMDYLRKRINAPI